MDLEILVAAAEAARLVVDAEPQRIAAQAPSSDVETPSPSAGAIPPAVPVPETTAAAAHPLLQAPARELAAALDRFDEQQPHTVLDRLLALDRHARVKPMEARHVLSFAVTPPAPSLSDQTPLDETHITRARPIRPIHAQPAAYDKPPAALECTTVRETLDRVDQLLLPLEGSARDLG